MMPSNETLLKVGVGLNFSLLGVNALLALITHDVGHVLIVVASLGAGLYALTQLTVDTKTCKED